MFVILKKFGYYFGIPFGCFAFYVIFCLFLQRLHLMSSVESMMIGDLICAILFGIIYYKLCVKSVSKDECKLFKFTGTAIFVLFILFVWQYVFGQATSAWVGIKFPSEYMSTYNTMSDTDLMIYLLLSVSFGPIVEELLFRGLFYKHLRKRFGMLFCFIISTAVFMFSHGTTEHLPVTLALSMLICFVYDVTGNMWYCILIHVLNNLVSMAYIVQVPISFVFSVIIFVVYIFVMFLLFAFVPVMRKWMKYDADKPTLTAKLEEKRKHWGDCDL